jgi:hypothetical protein
MAHAPRITPGRRRFLHHRAAVRQRLATIKRLTGRRAAGTSRPAAGPFGFAGCRGGLDDHLTKGRAGEVGELEGDPQLAGDLGLAEAGGEQLSSAGDRRRTRQP